MSESIADRLRRLDAEADQPIWHVNVNDLIGGFSIGIESHPVSQGPHADSIADMMTQANAESVVVLRNALPAILRLIEATREVKLEHRDSPGTDLSPEFDPGCEACKLNDALRALTEPQP